MLYSKATVACVNDGGRQTERALPSLTTDPTAVPFMPCCVRGILISVEPTHTNKGAWLRMWRGRFSKHSRGHPLGPSGSNLRELRHGGAFSLFDGAALLRRRGPANGEEGWIYSKPAASRNCSKRHLLPRGCAPVWWKSWWDRTTFWRPARF